jgi:adenylate cyclase
VAPFPQQPCELDRCRIVKLNGDGAIVEFGSVVDAVDYALSVQRSAATLDDARQPAIRLRIGINLGDVLIERDDIYVDGVNIAARLEPFTEQIEGFAPAAQLDLTRR